MKIAKFFVPILIAVSLVACGSAPATAEATPIPTVVADDTIIAEGKLEPIHYIELSLNASGQVSEVLVEEGDTVATGDVIASLKSNETRTLADAQADAAQELTDAYKEFRDAQSRLDDFDVPSQFSGMTPPEAVSVMLERLDQARADFEPYKHLDDKKVNYAEPKVDLSSLSPEQLEAHFEMMERDKYKERPLTGEARVKKKALDKAWNLYRLSIKWLDLETKFQNAETRLADAQSNYDALYDPAFALDTAGIRAVLANAELRTPYSGVVTDLNLKVGEFASAGAPVVTIADISRMGHQDRRPDRD
ncbi:MAG: biotin/lipoyl-binding protein [Chloroflexi bacterium]|nr:biotin/lipoyl-binding protein [Chloroflexota bacterium]